MTSGTFETILLSSIAIDRPARQRRELRNLETLAASIAAIGLINPPVITPEGILVAGERRLEACRQLGWTSIPVQRTTDLSPSDLHLLELEENVKREDLTWQEHNDAIAAYHRLQGERDPEWNAAKTAQNLGIDSTTVSRHLTVAKVRSDGGTPINDAEQFSSALNIARRRVERQRNEILREIVEPEETEKALPLADAAPRFAAIETASFLEWAKTPRTPFNLIHCDFPYGINTGGKAGQSAAKHIGFYSDSESVFFDLLDAFGANLNNFCAPSAHLIFWFSMKFYEPTRQILENQGWDVDPFPLVWHKSDNAGIIPDPNRGGRRTYETAFFASRGDRPIVRPIALSFPAPTTKNFHTSEKSAVMLEHFFRMVLDDTTRLLDPTCGSGMAVKVAEAMGASFALGLELNPEFAESARRNVGL